MKRLIFFSLTALWPAAACTPVAGDRIAGRDMAAEHPAFAGIAPDTDLGPAPVAGVRRQMLSSELERLARQHGIALPEGARREACFERMTVRLSEETLRAVLPAGLTILDFSRAPLPLGQAEFRAQDLAPDGLWRGRWVYGAGRSVPVWVRVQMPGSSGRSFPGKPEIARGDKIRVEIRSGGVLLAFDAAAESSGRAGEAVVVRNPENGQRFRAIVEAPGKAGIRK